MISVICSTVLILLALALVVYLIHDVVVEANPAAFILLAVFGILALIAVTTLST